MIILVHKCTCLWHRRRWQHKQVVTLVRFLIAGGVLECLGCRATVSACEFVSNSARAFGGVFRITSSSTVLIEDSSFSANEALLGGGVAHSFGELTVRRSSFSANRAGLGGAFYLGTGVRGEGGANSFVDSVFSRNVAYDSSGGAIVVFFPALGTSATSKGLRLANSTFDRNDAKKGGGAVYAKQSQLRVSLCRFTSVGADADSLTLQGPSSPFRASVFHSNDS